MATLDQEEPREEGKRATLRDSWSTNIGEKQGRMVRESNLSQGPTIAVSKMDDGIVRVLGHDVQSSGPGIQSCHNLPH